MTLIWKSLLHANFRWEAVSKYYDFTYNQLYIGRGIERMLQQLETRYGLNFSELEKEYTARNSGHNPPVE